MRVEFLTGSSGSGKTFSIREKISNNPSFGQLCGSTGIASVNLGVATIHSLLGFFDLASLQDAYGTGKLLKRIRKVADEGYQNIILDEVSMFGKEMLEIIYKAISEVNHIYSHDLGLICVGDFLQLPPVKAPFAFEASCWPEFAENTTRLTKIWRQSDESFINALNYARSGNGADCISTLIDACGITLETNLDQKFKGTTIVAKNDQVDRYNWLALNEIKQPSIYTYKTVKGLPLSDWSKIPDKVEFRLGAYTMLLSNLYEYELGSRPEIIYANGDCCFIKDYDPLFGFSVELVRTGKEVEVGYLTRYNTQRSTPEKQLREEIKQRFDYEVYQKKIGDDLVWVLGEVTYMPMRLAYCSTTHKSQGLSLDRAQIDIRDHFFSHPGMTYVALSRARTSQGLRLVGNRETFIKRCKIDPKVKEFI